MSDISLIVTAHGEGMLAAPSLKSAAMARKFAEERGISVETIHVLDRADAATMAQFRENPDKNARLLEVDFGDLGLARNAGVAAATGRWVAFLDADDLFEINWLSAAYRLAEGRGAVAIWHPEVNLQFGDFESVFTHVDMEAPGFDVAGLAVANYWSALCFSPRSILLEVPYRAVSTGDGIAYEDWAWNVETIGRGYLHKVVPGTVHAIRKKPRSLSKSAALASGLPHAPELFRDILRRRENSSTPR